MAGAEFFFLFHDHKDQIDAKNKKYQNFEGCFNWLVKLYKEKDLISPTPNVNIESSVTCWNKCIAMFI